MPCYDGREREDALKNERLHDAMTALLCGVMSKRPDAVELAEAWQAHHQTIDLLRQSVDYDWRNPEIGKHKAAAEAVLMAVHAKFCV